MVKIVFKIWVVVLFLTSCNLKPKSFEQMMAEIREDFAKKAEINNAKILAWENLVDSLYQMADTNQTATFLAIDHLISNDTSLNRHRISELHFIKGDIYYHIDSFQKSITEFTAAGVTYAPKHLAARAGAYLKLNQYSNALEDLTKAAKFNYDFFWNIGNYYEVIGNRDTAISYYTRLYSKDTMVYKFCQDRITELEKPDTKLLTELVLHKRKRVVILMKGAK